MRLKGGYTGAMSNSVERFSRWSPWLAVLAAVVAFTGIASAVALERFWSFSQPLGLDNAYFFQRVWQSVFLEEPARTLLNTEVGQGLIAGRHVEPFLFFATPAVRWAPRMESLLVFQVLIMSAGGVAAYGIAKKSTRDFTTAWLLMAAWFCTPGLWDMATTDFRSINLSVSFVALAWWAWLEQKPGWAILAGLLAMSCREEVVWLMMAGLPVVVALQASSQRIRNGALFLASGGLWLAVVGSINDAPSDFIGLQEAPSAALEALRGLTWGAPVHESSPGGVLSQLQSATGSGFWLLPVAPIAAIPVGVSWLGKAIGVDVAGPWAYHLWAVAIGSMALVVPLAITRIGRAVQNGRGGDWGVRSTRALAGALLVLQAQQVQVRYGEELSRVGSVWTGEGSPSLRLGTAWEAIRRVPDEVPVLTEAYFVAQLASRTVIYAADDFHQLEEQEAVLSSVEWVLLRKSHDWMPLVEAAGFEPYAEGGTVRLHHRQGAPGVALNPILPE